MHTHRWYVDETVELLDGVYLLDGAYERRRGRRKEKVAM